MPGVGRRERKVGNDVDWCGELSTQSCFGVGFVEGLTISHRLSTPKPAARGVGNDSVYNAVYF